VGQPGHGSENDMCESCSSQRALEDGVSHQAYFWWLSFFGH
jgi:hypothetical protein